jgi:hypothetical protein
LILTKKLPIRGVARGCPAPPLDKNCLEEGTGRKNYSQGPKMFSAGGYPLQQISGYISGLTYRFIKTIKHKDGTLTEIDASDNNNSNMIITTR